MLPIKWHVPALLGLSLITAAPGLVMLSGIAGTQKEAIEHLKAMQEATKEDEQIGLIRSKTCMVIDTKTPLTADTKPITYQGTNRRIPPGTSVCDRNGLTAIATDTGVADIRPINPKTLQKALENRKK